MQGRKEYSHAELERGRAATRRLLAAYKKMVKALPDDPDADAARALFDAEFFNTFLLALDRPFVHRLRVITGKDGNPLNEVELLVASLLDDDGVFRGNNVIKYRPEESITGLEPGEKVKLTAKDFERLSEAFYTEIERRF